MKVSVRFYGLLADVTGLTSLELENITDTVSLQKNLEDRFGEFKRYIYRISVNQLIINGNQSLQDGDVISLIPPFPGG